MVGNPQETSTSREFELSRSYNSQEVWRKIPLTKTNNRNWKVEKKLYFPTEYHFHCAVATNLMIFENWNSFPKMIVAIESN